MKIISLNETSAKEIKDKLSKRSSFDYGNVEDIVNEILNNIRSNGDKALFEYTKKFDGFDVNEENLEVSENEIQKAFDCIDKNLLEVIKKAHLSIKDFHQKQLSNSWFTTKDGILLGQKVLPMERAGVYVPGGKAVYPSSVLMNIIPAKVAGVEEIIMTTPPDKNGNIADSTLVAASIGGVDRIFKCGGAQAIAALAYGTNSVPKVDKITGPGNIYVAMAKKAVFGHVSIDSIAGPSEILVLADETANPAFVAADLLSQAEHDEMASAILVSTSESLCQKVNDEIQKQLEVLSRKDIIKKSLEDYGYLIYVDSHEKAIDICNMIASEHLEIITANPYSDMTKIKHAGAIFLGAYSSEPLGDYYAGPNHVLPTNGTARFFSALSVDDFIKKTSVISYDKEALLAVCDTIEAFAKSEQLDAHANSIAIRR